MIFAFILPESFQKESTASAVAWPSQTGLCNVIPRIFLCENKIKMLKMP